MSVEGWTPPPVAPRNGRYDADTRVLMVPDTMSVSTEPVTAPIEVREVQAWARPTSAACFPLHPAGATELYDRVCALMQPVLTELLPGESSHRLGERQAWRSTCLLFFPGRSIRACIDQYIEARHFMPSLSLVPQAERRQTTRVALLAAWAVVGAAADWAREVK